MSSFKYLLSQSDTLQSKRDPPSVTGYLITTIDRHSGLLKHPHRSIIPTDSLVTQDQNYPEKPQSISLIGISFNADIIREQSGRLHDSVSNRIQNTPSEEPDELIALREQCTQLRGETISYMNKVLKGRQRV